MKCGHSKCYKSCAAIGLASNVAMTVQIEATIDIRRKKLSPYMETFTKSTEKKTAKEMAYFGGVLEGRMCTSCACWRVCCNKLAPLPAMGASAGGLWAFFTCTQKLALALTTPLLLAAPEEITLEEDGLQCRETGGRKEEEEEEDEQSQKEDVHAQPLLLPGSHEEDIQSSVPEMLTSEDSSQAGETVEATAEESAGDAGTGDGTPPTPPEDGK
eukprot:15361229-Ditylum_brightwellii.AAC.1